MLKEENAQTGSFILIFLPAACSEEASPDSVDSELGPILLQFAILRVHRVKLSDRKKHKRKQNFEIPDLETSGHLNEMFGKFNNFERCLRV